MRKAPKRPIKRSQPDVVLPEARLDALDTAERVINYCKKNGFINDVEIDIERVINENPNLYVVKKSLPDGVDAYIKEVGHEKYEIGINSKHSKSRQRFSMAHEFAHYQLHRDNLKDLAEGERILHRSDERNKIEYQANNFAAEVLMPENVLREQTKRLGGKIEDLAKKFGVSQLALRYRAKNLGMRGHGV